MIDSMILLFLLCVTKLRGSFSSCLPPLITEASLDHKLQFYNRRNHSFKVQVDLAPQIVSLQGANVQFTMTSANNWKTASKDGIHIEYAPFVWIYGPALLTAKTTLIGNGSVYMATFRPTEVGNYSIYVVAQTSIGKDKNAAYSVLKEPVLLQVLKNTGEDVTSDLTNICKSGYTEDGRWVRCSQSHINGAPACTRDGWIWKPSNCIYDITHPWVLPDNSKPIWIVVIGTSTIRGLWYEFVDMVLPDDVAAPLAYVDWW